MENQWFCKSCFTHNPDERLVCSGCGCFYTAGAGAEDAHRLTLAECARIEREREVKDGQGD